MLKIKRLPRSLRSLAMTSRDCDTVSLGVVVDLLEEQGTMGSKAISKYLEIHQNTALKRLRWLEQKGLVHRQGRGTKVRYRPK